MEHTHYHKLLRVGALVLALVLVFDSGLLFSRTAVLSHGTQSYVASVIGVGASVAPTELNQLTAELTAQKRELDAREAALKERELNIGLGSGGSENYSTYVLASILFILLVLILLNYTLDYLRSREERNAVTV